jgi:hypothetical protein
MILPLRLLMIYDTVSTTAIRRLHACCLFGDLIEGSVWRKVYSNATLVDLSVFHVMPDFNSQCRFTTVTTFFSMIDIVSLLRLLGVLPCYFLFNIAPYAIANLLRDIQQVISNLPCYALLSRLVVNCCMQKRHGASEKKHTSISYGRGEARAPSTVSSSAHLWITGLYSPPSTHRISALHHSTRSGRPPA